MSIWGLEGRHQWNGGVILNRNVDDAGAVLLPRYKCRRIGGLSSTGDSEDVRELAVGREGEIPRRSFRRGKTITYEGVTQARSLASLRTAEDALRAAFDDLRTEKVMTVTPHPLYGAGSRFYRARALAVEIDDEQGPPSNVAIGYERGFIVTVRCSDRRYYDGTEQSQSVLLADGADVETVVCANGGTVNADPVFTLTSANTAAAWAPVKVAGLPISPDGSAVHSRTRLGADMQIVWDSLAPGGRKTIDGVGLYIGDRILYCDPAGGADAFYGLYTVLFHGIWSLTLHREPDNDATAEFAYLKKVSVTSGVAYGGHSFEQLTPGAVTVWTTPVSFGPVPPAQGLVLANDTVGASLELPGIVLQSTDELVIDFRTRSVKLNGVEAPNLLDVGSDWWDSGVAGLVPGNNTIRVQTLTGGAGAIAVTCDITWHNAFA